MKLASSAQKIGLDPVVGGIRDIHAVHMKRIAVEVGSERVAGGSPHTLLVFLHDDWLWIAFERDGDFPCVGCAQAEGDSMVGLHIGRNQRRRGRWWRLGRFGLLRRSTISDEEKKVRREEQQL